jgi:hypothetical protein
MTNEDKKLIFDYCGWKYKKCALEHDREFCSEYEYCIECHYYVLTNEHLLDGNDILEAVTIMESKGDIGSFNDFSLIEYCKQREHTYIPYLLQNFFKLFVAWLKEKQCT